MPAGLRGYERDRPETLNNEDIGACMMLSFPEFQLYLRSHDYFMGMLLNIIQPNLLTIKIEMTLNVDTIYGTVHADCSEDLTHARSTQREAKETFVVDGKVS